MLTRRALLAAPALASRLTGEDTLVPRGRIHIPIGVPNTLDTLKTFVEPEGCFSPGFGTYGVYFRMNPGVARSAEEYGLLEDRYLLPWCAWSAGGVRVKVELCQVAVAPDAQVVGVRVTLSAETAARALLEVILRDIGPAGGDVSTLAATRDALLVNGRPAVVPHTRPHEAAGGALRFDLRLRPAAPATLHFVCPVLPGRRAARHRWEDWKQNAMVDAAPLDSGVPQKDLGLKRYRSLRVNDLFAKAAAYWKDFAGRFTVDVPDPRWGHSMAAILSHAAIAMNEGAPDVAVINYNVYNRDGMYVANMLQKAGHFALAAEAIDYFLAHPFNGRAYPEADNPGQILWILGEHWLITRDREWLERVYPAVEKLAAMITYYRTTAEPHWVGMNSLEFGDRLDPATRQELKPGRCDGFHPEYTEAFDIAGLRAAATLAEAMGEFTPWRPLAARLLADYERRFGANLLAKYGSYSVLWPCRLYREHEQFRRIGAQEPKSWRYFPLATAHQGLLAGNREAAWKTLDIHLAHEQMRRWYAFDEGGGSGSGGWWRARTNWPHSKEKPGENKAAAMPHGWAIAEFWHLLRDSLLFEDGGRLVLLAGIPPEWFAAPQPVVVRNLHTHFGPCSFTYQRNVLEVTTAIAPPEGFRLMLPDGSARDFPPAERRMVLPSPGRI